MRKKRHGATNDNEPLLANSKQQTAKSRLPVRNIPLSPRILLPASPEVAIARFDHRERIAANGPQSSASLKIVFPFGEIANTEPGYGALVRRPSACLPRCGRNVQNPSNLPNQETLWLAKAPA
jgi:hypothetical protein